VARVLRISRVSRCVRLLRMLQGSNVFSRLEEVVDLRLSQQCATVARLLVSMFLVFGHWLACLWHSVGLGKSSSVPGDGVQRVCKGLVVLGQCSWIDAYMPNGRDATLSDRYTSSLYHVMGTMATVGSSIAPTNSAEELVQMCFALCATVVFSVLAATLAGLIASAGVAQEDGKRKVRDAVQYMKVRRVPLELQSRVRRYMHFMLARDSRTAMHSEVQQMLSSSLNAELASEVRGSMLRRIPVSHGRHPVLFLGLR